MIQMRFGAAIVHIHAKATPSNCSRPTLLGRSQPNSPSSRQQSAVATKRLRSAPEDKPVKEQQQHRADDGANKSGGLSGLIQSEHLPEITGDNGTRDSQQHRNDAT